MREVERKRGAAPQDAAPHVHEAVVFLDDPVHDGEAQSRSGALPGFLVLKNGSKTRPMSRAAIPGPRIRDRQHSIIAGLDGLVAGDPYRQTGQRGLDGDGTPVQDGLGGIANQVANARPS